MAFVVTPPTSSALRLSHFTASPSASLSSSSRRALPRPARATSSRALPCASASGDADESPVVGVVGNSAWKEDVFAGGFPGGEAYFQNWIDKGMMDDVPDMPKSMQPSAQFKPVTVERTGILADLEKVEFFKSFIGTPQSAEAASSKSESESESESVPEPEPEPESKSDAGAGVGAGANASVSVKVSAAPIVADADATPGGLDTEVPDESLYEAYFPKDVRNLAPSFIFDVCDNPHFNRVGLSMQPVDASVGDLYYPDMYKNKAPFIDIQYSGAVATSSVCVSFDEVDPLPSLQPPPSPGQVLTTLSPGAGGGLKLSFSVDGESM